VRSGGKLAETLWGNVESAVELARHILEGDQASQIDDGVIEKV
jgi:hypothetical protein